MAEQNNRTSIDFAARKLRSIILDAEEGVLLGSEDKLTERLKCSRATVRQVARLLEREGLLRVRRGIGGGYFGSRPNAGTIETTVSAYLETIEMEPEEITLMASALWVEAVRKAARSNKDLARKTADQVLKRLATIRNDASFEQIRDVEIATQNEIFALANSNYIKLIFDVNIAFSRRKFPISTSIHDDKAHLEFVQRWRSAKQLEANAIGATDPELAAMAARHARSIWHQRIRARFFDSDDL